MALRATSPLLADPSSTTRPVDETFDFTVDVVDRRAGTAIERTLELFLAPDNDLVFVGGSKTVTKKVRVGSEPVTVTFPQKRITGSGDDLSSFRVSLREKDGSTLVFCLITLQ
jgi:hypothetical protein